MIAQKKTFHVQAQIRHPSVILIWLVHLELLSQTLKDVF